jgi:hypothetical protein
LHTGRRFVVISLVSLFCSLSAFPQPSGTSANEDNLYSKALIASITEMEKSWSYIDDGDHGGRIRTDYHRMLVRKNPEITDHLLAQFGDHHVDYLDDLALIDKYKARRKEFSILEVHPMRNDGTRLKINVSVSWVRYENGKLILAFSDWADVEFLYDCQNQSYSISGVKLGGI